MRLRNDLTQTRAAMLVCAKLRTWQDWESGTARMHPGLWQLFLLKTREKFLVDFDIDLKLLR